MTTTVESLLSVEVPPEWLLTSNQRLYWAQKAERTQWLRSVAHLAGLGARRRLQQWPIRERVQATVFVAWPDRRRRDVHNVMPTVKACIDGLVDAKILVDDSDEWLQGPDLRVLDQLCDKRRACQLDFVFGVTA